MASYHTHVGAPKHRQAQGANTCRIYSTCSHLVREMGLEGALLNSNIYSLIIYIYYGTPYIDIMLL